MRNPGYPATAEPRLPTDWLDHTILAIYFVVLGTGFAARRSVRTSLGFVLSFG